MLDREKVIKGLEECAGNGNCMKCQYGKEKQALSCKKLLSDALELIKSSRLIHSDQNTLCIQCMKRVMENKMFEIRSLLIGIVVGIVITLFFVFLDNRW